MKKSIPFLLCLVIGLIIAFTNTDTSQSNPMTTYPNLPAPIGKEKILITSAGQAMEGAIVYSISESLHLDADYRPRALDSDLYDYQSVIIILGYSANGLAYTNRSFQEELNLTKQLLIEAALQELPIIVVDLSSRGRDSKHTRELFELVTPYTAYYIGLKNEQGYHPYKQELQKLDIPVTLLNELDDLATPLNSAFR